MPMFAGDESKTMLDAHCQAGFLVGVPFAHEGEYDFKLHGGMCKADCNHTIQTSRNTDVHRLFAREGNYDFKLHGGESQESNTRTD